MKGTKEFMKNQSPYLVVYDRTYEEAQDVIYRRCLRNCEIDPRALVGVMFSDEKDLVLFALRFRPEAMFDGSQAFLAPWYKTAVLDFIEEHAMTDRVRCADILGVWFWVGDDEADDEPIFTEELSLMM
jgi:hypothetical protein